MVVGEGRRWRADIQLFLASNVTRRPIKGELSILDGQFCSFTTRGQTILSSSHQRLFRVCSRCSRSLPNVPRLFPTSRVSSQRSTSLPNVTGLFLTFRSVPNVPGLFPTFRVSSQRSGSLPNVLGLFPTFRVSAQCSGSLPNIPGLFPGLGLGLDSSPLRVQTSEVGGDEREE